MHEGDPHQLNKINDDMMSSISVDNKIKVNHSQVMFQDFPISNEEIFNAEMYRRDSREVSMYSQKDDNELDNRVNNFIHTPQLDVNSNFSPTPRVKTSFLTCLLYTSPSPRD